ncbi:swi5-like zinc finger protein [Gryganskiella cystojenkinii]|nr:swi5-like zinc finger protein [Gryganskiella cystojenkinii]
MDKPLEEPQQATNVQSTEAKAASSDSILKPHSLSSSSTMNQLDRHRSKHASQEQHKVTEAKEDAKIEELKATIRDLERQEQEIMSAIRGEGTPTEIINRRIDQLHKYNEIKDVGQIVLGKCAEIEGTTVKKQYENYGLNLDD